MASSIDSVLFGLHCSAESPAISGNEPLSDITAAVPHDIDSSTGKPNPS